jgi:hypothetical protein
MEYTLAYTALMNSYPGYAGLEVSEGSALTSRLVVAWRNRREQRITFADFSARWIRENS